jgi:molybdate transport system substrate-binding protein
VRLSVVILAVALLGAACSAAGSSALPSGADPSAGGSTRLLVAAASDLRFALDDLVAEWRLAGQRIEVEPVYGSSGNFLAQITQGAPFDVFFSADAEYPRELERAGLAEVGATRLYAIGQIVVWVLADSPLDVEARGLAALTDPSVETVAIANPEHAPYGRAAVAAMRSAGVYEAVEPKLVLGENVSQAAQFVESGNADAGVIALSLALAPTMAEAGRYALVPIDSYPPIEQGVVVLDAAGDPDAARAFVDFVLGPDGRAVLDRYGFLLPEP